MNGVEFTLTSREMYAFALFVARAGERNINAEATKNWCREIIGEYTKEWKPE